MQEMARVMCTYGYGLAPSGGASRYPKAGPSAKAPAGDFSSPSFLIGPGSWFDCKPRPHAMPCRPRFMDDGSPCGRHAPPAARSNRCSVPVVVVHEAERTTMSWRVVTGMGEGCIALDAL